MRPTTLDPRPPWHRNVAIAAVIVSAILAVSVGVAWWQDRSSTYPGYRTAVDMRALAISVLPPTNSLVSTFPNAGPLGRVGHFAWTTAVGRDWHALADRAFAPPGGGVVVIDPHHTSLLAQVEVFHPVPGAGLVFRWRDQADHFSVEVAPGGTNWQLVATIGGSRFVLHTITVNPQGSTVGVSLNGSEIEVDVNGAPRFTQVDPYLAGLTALGMKSPSNQTGFAQFTVLPG